MKLKVAGSEPQRRHILSVFCIFSKGVGMIRAEIGLKNRQIINERHSFRCFLILLDLYSNYYFGNNFPYLPLRGRHTSLSFRENIWNLTRNVYSMSIFSITTSRYHRHILVWCLIYINTYLISVLVPECGEYEICNQKIILRSISPQRPFLIDRFHP